jgi:hypothetical protein
MLDRSRRERMTVRVIRRARSESRDDDWTTSSPEERIEAVWTRTKLCLAWNQDSDHEPRLQRTITHLQRRDPYVSIVPECLERDNQRADMLKRAKRWKVETEMTKEIGSAE